MKNDFAKRLNNAHTKGVNDGFNTAMQVILLSLYNVGEEYTDKLPQFARELEVEMLRIIHEELKGDIDGGELALGHIEEIRKKWGMDE